MYKFNAKRMKTKLTRWVVLEVESDNFRSMLLELNPSVKDACCLPTHRTMRNWILADFDRFNEVIKGKLQNAVTYTFLLTYGHLGLLPLFAESWFISLMRTASYVHSCLIFPRLRAIIAARTSHKPLLQSPWSSQSKTNSGILCLIMQPTTTRQWLR